MPIAQRPNHGSPQRIVTASSDNTARVWDIQGNLLQELKGHQSWVSSANFSPDGQRVVTASYDNARVWDMQGNLIGELKGHQHEVTSANFSPDGQRVITASRDRTVRVWDLQGNLIQELKGHQHEVTSANVSPEFSNDTSGCLVEVAGCWKSAIAFIF